MKVAVVGAGISGLMAARALADAGHVVTVFERGRTPGGRLATRRIGSARLDHGAQFFTVRSEQFAAHVQTWRTDGLVYEWCRGFADVPDGYPRYAVRAGMNTLAKHVAKGLDVRCTSLVFAVDRNTRGPGRWSVKLDDATVTAVDAVVVTCPLPQSYSLLVNAEVGVPDLLWRTDYDRTLALLAVLDGRSAIQPPGAVQRVAPFELVADNHVKGVSEVPALTLHADSAWSAAHWDDDRAATHAEMLDLARPYLGRAPKVIESQLKRWRFATPKSVWPEPCWSPIGDETIVLAGDAFAGPRVEGAALSGLAAAAARVDAGSVSSA